MDKIYLDDGAVCYVPFMVFAVAKKCVLCYAI